MSLHYTYIASLFLATDIELFEWFVLALMFSVYIICTTQSNHTACILGLSANGTKSNFIM